MNLPAECSEILKMAARAAGLSVRGVLLDGSLDIGSDRAPWNPLTNDADAFGLMAELCISVDLERGSCGDVRASAAGFYGFFDESHVVLQIAVRRAIVRVAAAMSKHNEIERRTT